MKDDKKKLTGYPSIDKPQNKFFPEEATNLKVPTMSMYDYMVEKAQKNKNAIAINYFNKHITYEELLDKIEETSKAFSQIGIKEGDNVMALMPSSPEAAYAVYALNKIGAVFCPIDPRTKTDIFQKYLKDINPKAIVTLDNCSKMVFDNCKDSNVGKIISVSAIESLPSGIRTMDKFVNILKGQNNNIKDEKEIKWKNFIKDGKQYNKNNYCPANIDKLATIIYTGGTTGSKKGVELYNNSINTMVEQHRVSGIPFSVGQKFLDFLPPFISYGLVMAIHMPLSFGFEIKMVPIFKPEDFPKLLTDSKSAYVFASPVHYEKLLKSNKKLDLSFITCPISGGDSMTAAFEQKVDDKLAECNCTAKLGQGLGMTEAGGTISVPVPGKIKVGSVGLPFPNNDFGVFDPIAGDELTYYEKGELCFSGDTLMKRYHNNPEETKKVLKLHADGKLWLHTGDIGYIDKDGYIYHVDRIKRIINRGGLKVYPSEVEKVIMTADGVSSCVVVSADNVEERHVPIAHVILKGERSIAATEEEIIKICEQKLDTESIPYGIKIHDKFPYTANGKVDYKELEEEEYGGIDLSQDIMEHKVKVLQKK